MFPARARGNGERASVKSLAARGGRLWRVFFLLAAQSLAGLDNVSMGFDFTAESNRVFPAWVEFASFGSLLFDSAYSMASLNTGVSLGVSGSFLVVKTFAKAELSLKNTPLSGTFHYIYNGLPAYKTHIQTLTPMLSLNGRWVGTSLGPAWHFTVFDREMVITEPVLAFSAYINVYNAARGRIGIRCANITDFVSGAMGAYALTAYSALFISKRCFIINDITLYQSGSVGLAAAYYGFSYRGGLVFTW